MNKIINDICTWNYVRNNTTYGSELEYRMLKEEVDEFAVSRELPNTAKELADIIFVAVGSLYKLTGANHEKTEKILEEVIKANYAKGGERVEGKVVKGKDYVNPEGIIEEILTTPPNLWGSYLDKNEHIYPKGA